MAVAKNLPIEAQACVDAIYKRESGGDYTILFGGKAFDLTTPHFTDATPSLPNGFGFPDWPGVSVMVNGQQRMTHAAGAGQFQPATWKGVCASWPAGSTPNFRDHGDQDWGTWFLAQETVPDLLNKLKAKDLAGIGDKLHGEWTSVSEATFADRYKAALEAIQAAPAPVPPPQPVPVPVPPPPVPTPAPTPVPPLDPFEPAKVELRRRIAAAQAVIAAAQAALTALDNVPKEPST